MLFNELYNQTNLERAKSQPNVCPVCFERKVTPRICSFEYLPIFPRIRAFVSNENSVSDLYEYRLSSILNRELEGDESERLYMDFSMGLSTPTSSSSTKVKRLSSGNLSWFVL